MPSDTQPYAGTLKKKVGAFGRHFGLSEKQALACLTKHPQLLGRSAATIIENSAKLAELLGMPASAQSSLLKAGPTIFCMSPARMARFLRDFVGRFGISEAAAIGALRRRPHLLSSDVKTLRQNIEQLAALFGVSKEQVAQRALCFPTLFVLNSELIKDRVDGLAREVGIEANRVFEVYLKSPTFFARKNAGILNKLRICARLPCCLASRSARQRYLKNTIRACAIAKNV